MIDLSIVRDWLQRVFPHYKDSPEKRTFKVTMLIVVGMVLVMALIGLLTFWLAVQGAEEVLVPNLAGKQIVTALLEMQEKELYAKIQVRYSSEVERGLIIEQKPPAGSIVKAGRRVALVVSRGPVIDRVENYVGQKIGDVRNHLQTLFASFRALLKIKEPVMLQYDPSPAGTIIAQKPLAGTELSGETYLELVVSKGPKEAQVKIGNLVGQDFQAVMSSLSSSALPFIFSVRKAAGAEKPGVIVSQSIEPDSEVPPGMVIQLLMTRPEGLPAGKVFGLFEYALPSFPILVDVRLDAVLPESTTTLLAMQHPGGPIVIPYIVDKNSELVLYLFNKEEMRQNAGS